MQWLSSYDAISAYANAAMVFVWLAYLQLFYLGFRRQRQPCVLIQQSGGTDGCGDCILANMSASAVDIACVQVVATVDGQERTRSLEELASEAMEAAGTEGPSLRRHGPAAPGSATSLGSFSDFARLAPRLAGGGGDEASMSELEIRVVYFYRTSGRPLGARRRFHIRRHNGRTRFVPEADRTHQLVSLRGRRRAREWYREVFGSPPQGQG